MWTAVQKESSNGPKECPSFTLDVVATIKYDTPERRPIQNCVQTPKREARTTVYYQLYYHKLTLLATWILMLKKAFLLIVHGPSTRRLSLCQVQSLPLRITSRCPVMNWHWRLVVPLGPQSSLIQDFCKLAKRTESSRCASAAPWRIVLEEFWDQVWEHPAGDIFSGQCMVTSRFLRTSHYDCFPREAPT